MKYGKLGRTGPEASRIVLGCMRLGGKSDKNAEELLAAALDAGVDMFDHADIYADGESERKFARAAKALKLPREKSCCNPNAAFAAARGCTIFSGEYILSAAEGILKRLHTDYLDILLLHRPDALMEPEEVLSAFEKLHRSGKVRFFGVSNFSALQMQLLMRGRVELIANQRNFPSCTRTWWTRGSTSICTMRKPSAAAGMSWISAASTG